MKETLDELIHYLKNPVLEKDKNTALSYRLKILINLFLISLITTFTLTMLTAFIEATGVLEMTKHSLEGIMENSTNFKLFLLAAVFAPVIEECIFRAPIVLFKKPLHFKIAFYTATILFGYMHIFNFEFSLNILLFSPLLVAPQLCIGLYLGFIRVRLGLIWSIASHACYNGFVLSLFLLAKDATTT